MKRMITKSIIRNQFGLLETTDKLGTKHKFFATRSEAAKFLRRLRSLRLTLRARYLPASSIARA